MSSQSRRPKAPWWAFFVLFAVIFILYLPVIVMVVSSVLVKTDHWVISLKWYREILHDSDLIDALVRSLKVGFTSSLVSTLIGGFAAIALVKSKFRFAKTVDALSFLSLVVPELVFALSLLSWFFVLRLELSLFTVILAHITFSLCFVLMTVNGRLASLDMTIEDAARDLGANEWRILWTVTLPLIITSLLAGFLLAFLLSFDDFLITFFTCGVGSDTLPIRLYAAMKSGLTPKLSALATLMLAFTIALILLLKRARGLKIFGQM